MENEQMLNIPYIAHESAMARQERTIKKLWVALLLVICLLVATNGLWIWYESQWTTVETTVTQDVDAGVGGRAIINDGVHINGESATDSNG